MNPESGAPPLLQADPPPGQWPSFDPYALGRSVLDKGYPPGPGHAMQLPEPGDRAVWSSIAFPRSANGRSSSSPIGTRTEGDPAGFMIPQFLSGHLPQNPFNNLGPDVIWRSNPTAGPNSSLANDLSHPVKHFRENDHRLGHRTRFDDSDLEIEIFTPSDSEDEESLPDSAPVGQWAQARSGLSTSGPLGPLQNSMSNQSLGSTENSDMPDIHPNELLGLKPRLAPSYESESEDPTSSDSECDEESMSDREPASHCQIEDQRERLRDILQIRDNRANRGWEKAPDPSQIHSAPQSRTGSYESESVFSYQWNSSNLHRHASSDAVFSSVPPDHDGAAGNNVQSPPRTMNHHYKPDAPKSWLATLAPLDHWFSSTLDLILDDKIQSPEEEAQSYPLRPGLYRVVQRSPYPLLLSFPDAVEVRLAEMTPSLRWERDNVGFQYRDIDCLARSEPEISIAEDTDDDFRRKLHLAADYAMLARHLCDIRDARAASIYFIKFLILNNARLPTHPAYERMLNLKKKHIMKQEGEVILQRLESLQRHLSDFDHLRPPLPPDFALYCDAYGSQENVPEQLEQLKRRWAADDKRTRRLDQFNTAGPGSYLGFHPFAQSNTGASSPLETSDSDVDRQVVTPRSAREDGVNPSRVDTRDRKLSIEPGDHRRHEKSRRDHRPPGQSQAGRSTERSAAGSRPVNVPTPVRGRSQSVSSSWNQPAPSPFDSQTHDVLLSEDGWLRHAPQSEGQSSPASFPRTNYMTCDKNRQGYTIASGSLESPFHPPTATVSKASESDLWQRNRPLLPPQATVDRPTGGRDFSSREPGRGRTKLNAKDRKKRVRTKRSKSDKDSTLAHRYKASEPVASTSKPQDHQPIVAGTDSRRQDFDSFVLSPEPDYINILPDGGFHSPQGSFVPGLTSSRATNRQRHHKQPRKDSDESYGAYPQTQTPGPKRWSMLSYGKYLQSPGNTPHMTTAPPPNDWRNDYKPGAEGPHVFIGSTQFLKVYWKHPNKSKVAGWDLRRNPCGLDGNALLNWDGLKGLVISLTHHDIPWNILMAITTSGSSWNRLSRNAARGSELMKKLYMALQQRVEPCHLTNNILRDAHRERIEKARQMRCQDIPSATGDDGTRWVDFLGPQYILRGLEYQRKSGTYIVMRTTNHEADL